MLSCIQGPDHTHSGDGHDKLMGFMNSTFPLAVYGLQDAFSGYILYLKLWTTNSDPKLIGRFFFITWIICTKQKVTLVLYAKYIQWQLQTDHDTVKAEP